MSEDIEVAWYRKYRPSSIDDYMGENIQKIVNSRFTVAKNRPNVLMLYGERGCGKTTFARLISKYYLCESPVDGKPCESCSTCLEINETLIEGDSGVECAGVTEINGSNITGKAEIEEIIEEAILPPVYTQFKIIIFDECHRISQAAQNSMLKIIEDVPKHLIVIFATTEPDKVLGTIHSRCQLQIEVRKKTVQELSERLLYISRKERLVVELQALKMIVKAADRIPRDAINMLEDIAKKYNNDITVKNVSESIGAITDEVYLEFMRVSNISVEDILIFINGLKKIDMDFGKFMRGFMRFVLDSIYIRYGINLEEYTPEYVKQVKEVFKIYGVSDIDILLQILDRAYNNSKSDSVYNEMQLLLVGCRIGKIKFLNSGLIESVREARKEDNRSLKEYRERIENEREGLLDGHSGGTGVARNDIVSLFKNIVEVEDTIGDTRSNEIDLGEGVEGELSVQQDKKNNSEFIDITDLSKLFD